MQAHFYRNSDGLYEVTNIHGEHLQLFARGKKHIQTQELVQAEWQRILDYPDSSSEKISEFLHTHFLPHIVASKVIKLLPRAQSPEREVSLVTQSRFA